MPEYPLPDVLNAFPNELTIVDHPELSDEVKRRILWDNASALFGIAA